MKTFQSQQKSTNKFNSLIGFFISLALHCSLLFGGILFSKNIKLEEKKQPVVAISIKNFVPPAEPIEEEQIEEPIEEVEPLEEIIPEAVIPEPIIQKPKKKEKKKPKKQVKKAEKQEKKIEEPVESSEPVESTDIIADLPPMEINAGKKDNSEENDKIGTIINLIIAKYAKEHYPSRSRLRRETGISKVSFLLKTNGEVENIKVYESSNFKDLDNAVMVAIQKTKKKFPKPKEDVSFIVNIKFTLK